MQFKFFVQLNKFQKHTALEFINKKVVIKEKEEYISTDILDRKSTTIIIENNRIIGAIAVFNLKRVAFIAVKNKYRQHTGLQLSKFCRKKLIPKLAKKYHSIYGYVHKLDYQSRYWLQWLYPCRKAKTPFNLKLLTYGAKLRKGHNYG